MADDAGDPQDVRAQEGELRTDQMPVPRSQQGPPDEAATQEEIEHPAKLLRIAAMVQAMLQEVQTTELDDSGRERMTAIHNDMVSALHELVSDDLSAELSAFQLEPEEGSPSAAALRVVQAQLAGWLQGMFHGIQASIASQQMAARQQLAQMQQARAGEETSGRDLGQYL